MSVDLKLSIVVATFNRRPELCAMLETLLPQTADKSVEILIVDDRSTDDTWNWLQTEGRRSPGIRCFQMVENGGPGPARNLAISEAKGQYFMPIDSDFLVIEGAIDRVLDILEREPSHRLFFFPCFQYPAMKRMDRLTGTQEIDRRAFIDEQIGELLPMADLCFIKTRNLRYPSLRAGGESLLWNQLLLEGPALFVETPVIQYRTDVAQRICTLDYQLAHPADLAAIAEAMILAFEGEDMQDLRGLVARKYLAAGTYHVLAGDLRRGQKRLIGAVKRRCWTAIPAVVISLGGNSLFRKLFRFYRTRYAPAYL